MNAVEERRNLVAAFMVAFGSALLLVGYEFIRNSTNALFKQAFGKEALPYIFAAVPLFLFPMLLIYGRSLSKFGPRRTLVLTGLLASLCIALSNYFSQQGSRLAIAALFLIREAYIVFMIEQFWSFINSTFTQEEGKKFNGLLLVVCGIGPISAGLFMYKFTEQLGVTTLIYLAAFSLIPVVVIVNIAYQMVTPEAEARLVVPKNEHRSSLALELFQEHRVLRVILALILLSQVYSTMASLVFQGQLHLEYPNVDRQTAVAGLVFSSINFLGLSCQLIVVPILLRRFPLTIIHVGIAAIHLVTISLAVIFGGFWSSLAVLVAFKGLDYTVFRAAKEVFYIPLPFDARFRAKEVIDILGYRFSKGTTAFGISALQQVGVIFSERVFALIGMCAALGWFGTARSFHLHVESKQPEEAATPQPSEDEAVAAQCAQR